MALELGSEVIYVHACSSGSSPYPFFAFNVFSVNKVEWKLATKLLLPVDVQLERALNPFIFELAGEKTKLKAVEMNDFLLTTDGLQGTCHVFYKRKKNRK